MGTLLNVSEVMEFAVFIEKNGYRFYTETIKKFVDKELVELFQFLADEELRHQHTFEKLWEKVGTFTPPESYAGEYEMYMKDFLKTHPLANEEALKVKLDSISSKEEAVEMALDFEKDSIVLFNMLKRYIEEENIHIVEAVIQEELNHILRINQYRKGEQGQENR